MKRRQFVSGVLGVTLAPLVSAQTRIEKNVAITFPGTFPSVVMPIRAALAQRFSGNLVPYIGPSKDPRADSHHVRMRKVANGPVLDAGKSTYLMFGGSNEFAFDPLKDAARGQKSEGYSGSSFRPAYLVGELPYALVANRALGISNMDEFLALAERRMAAGQHLVCDVGGNLGAAFAHRFTNLTKAILAIDVHLGGDPRPQLLMHKRGFETAIVPVDPMLFAGTVKEKITVVTVLAGEQQPIISRQFGETTRDDGVPRLAAASRFASLGFVPSRGFFVSSNEDPATVEALFQSFRAASADPVMKNEYAYLVPLDYSSVQETQRRYQAELAHYERCASAGSC